MITTAAINAAEKVLPKKLFKFKQSLPWYTREVKILRRQLNRMKRRIRRASPKNKILLLKQFNTHKKLYSEAVTDAKIKTWKNYCGMQTKETIWTRMYKLMSEEENNHPLILLDEKGNLMDSEMALGNIQKAFFPKDDPELDSLTHASVRLADTSDEIFTNVNDRISYEETRHAFESCNPKKAPGID